MTYTVRPARPSDVSDLRDIFRRASLSNESDQPLLMEHPEWLEFSDDAVREGRTRVVVDSSDVALGFASYAIADGGVELVDLFVDPLLMRRGVGKMLVGALCEELATMNYESLDLVANSNALAFYEHVGFEAVEHVETDGSPALRMRKAIR